MNKGVCVVVVVVVVVRGSWFSPSKASPSPDEYGGGASADRCLTAYCSREKE